MHFNTNTYENELSNYGYEDLICSSFLQRLKGISFLATIDHVYSVKEPFSRYDHSLGTAYLALNLARQLKLNTDQVDTLVITNLLHDIGHAPFSHAAETFLIEKVRKYHEGLTSSYLRFNTRLCSESFTLAEILRNRSRFVQKAVANLLLNQESGDELVDSLYYCNINCDKLDGTNRALFSLGQKYDSPDSFIDYFSRENLKVYFAKSKLNKLSKFWSNKIKLYHQYIYTTNVLSAEAMLTRSLEIALPSKKLVTFFISSTDANMLNYLGKDESSKYIIEAFSKKKMFCPLSKLDVHYFSKIYDYVQKIRFDQLERKKIESEIGRKIGIDPKYVITHFSFKKDFKTNIGPLNQLSLFNDNNSEIYISDLNKSFYSVRVSGDVFDVFFPVTNQNMLNN